MTRKRTASGNKQGKATHGGQNNFGVQFVNIYLSQSDTEALALWDIPADEMWAEVERLTENGYKLSLSIDWNNTGAIASLTGTGGCPIEENIGKCLTARGPDVRGAMMCLLYKVSNYCIDGVFPLSGSTPAGPYS